MSLIRLLPRSALSTVVGKLTRAPAPASFHQAAMRVFAKRYNVSLEDAEGSVSDYPTFAQFFTRRLKPGLRPIDPAPGIVISPVDGAVSESGYVSAGACLQAKGITFPVGKLLGDEGRVELFVRDSGSGVPPHLLPRLFEPFFTTKPRRQGLSLSRARRYADYHGGVLELVRTGADGTEFRLSVPLSPAGQNPPALGENRPV